MPFLTTDNRTSSTLNGHSLNSMEIEFNDEDEELDVQGNPEKSIDTVIELTEYQLSWLQCIQAVQESGLYNFQGCRIPVGSHINIQLLDGLLTEYHDREILDFLQYGWPIERDPDIPLELGGINHKGATMFNVQVDEYIQKEIQLGAMIGPFEQIPFKGPIAISPLSTRPKKDSESRRVIMDCSWPIGASLNNGISKSVYLQTDIELKYPTIDMLAKRVYQLVTQLTEPVYLYKEDMDRAFHQLYGCPSIVPLLGFRWRNLYYFDLVMVMGCRIAPYVCQQTTDMVSYIHSKAGYFLLNYVDDFVGAEYESIVNHTHSTLVRLLSDIGLQRSSKKSVPPTQKIEFIGNLVDANELTISVTPDRCRELMMILEKWRYRKVCSRTQLESLIGKLQFVSNCVKAGRLFVSRLLNTLRGMNRNQWYVLCDEMRKDIRWWYLFLPKFSGTGILWLLEVEVIDSELAMDLCLLTAGGVHRDQYFRVRFPDYMIKQGSPLKITHFKLWAVIIAIKAWGRRLSGKILKVKTNKQAVAHIVNTGRSHDLMLQAQLRELVWWLCIHQMRVRSVYLPGKINKLPDLLSRWHEGIAVRCEFEQLTEGRNMNRITIPQSYFHFTHDW